MEKNKIDLAKLQEKGVNLEALEAQLKELRKAGQAGNVDKVANAEADMSAALMQLQEKVKELEGAATKQAQAEAYEEAKEEGAFEKFQNMTDTEKKDHFESLSEKAGLVGASYLLDGNKTSLKSIVLEPINSNKQDAEFREAVRDVHNKFVIAMGVRDGYSNFNDGTLSFQKNREVIDRTLNTFEKHYGKDVVDTYRKGLNEALDTQTATQGTEYLPVILAPDYIDAIFLETAVAGQFQRRPMPSKTWDIPVVSSRGRIYGVDEATAYNDFYANKFTPNQANTGKLTLTAQRYGYQALYSDELVEDSIIDIVDMLDEDVRRAFGEGLDDLVLNGATDATALDNAGGSGNELFTAASDIRFRANGLRRFNQQLASPNYVDGATMSVSVINNARALMGKYGANPNDLFMATSPNAYYKMITLSEVLTAQNHGLDVATIRNGFLGKIFGIDLILSENVYTNLNASGVYDNSTTTKTCVVMANRNLMLWGDRRMMTIERDRMISSQQNMVVAHMRADLKPKYPTAPMVSVIRNVTS